MANNDLQELLPNQKCCIIKDVQIWILPMLEESVFLSLQNYESL